MQSLLEPAQLPLVAVAEAPTELLAPSTDTPNAILSALKGLFAQVKQVEPVDSPLSTLHTDGFDYEQVWEQIRLLNEPITAATAEQTDAVVTAGHAAIQVFEESAEDAADLDDASANELGDNDFDLDGDVEAEDDVARDRREAKERARARKRADLRDDDTEEEHRKARSGKRRKPASAVDDDFFKLADMQAFLDAEDKREMKRDDRGEEDDEPDLDEDDEDDDGDFEEDENIDMFGDIGDTKDDKAARKAMYRDFFGGEDEEGSDEEGSDEDDGLEIDEDESADGDGTAEGPEHNDLFGDGEDDMEEDVVPLSRHAKQQRKIQEEIAQLEEFNVGDKPWQLAGEVQGGARPMDSLLQEDLDFEVTTAPAPEITEAVTKTLEERIIQRIRDRTFDDVERKADPGNLEAYRPRPTAELDSEKSAVGLGEVYAESYARRAANMPTAAEEKLSQAHEEIAEEMNSLFSRLDALTNFTYTPQTVEAEVKTVANVAAITMEEATPVTAAASTLLAPEEVHAKPKGDVKADDEKSETDRKRERRAKKQKKHFARLEKEAKELSKERAGKTSKREAAKKLKNAKNTTFIEGTKKKFSSEAVFKQLAAGETKKKKEKRKEDQGSALRL